MGVLKRAKLMSFSKGVLRTEGRPVAVFRLCNICILHRVFLSAFLGFALFSARFAQVEDIQWGKGPGQNFGRENSAKCPKNL